MNGIIYIYIKKENNQVVYVGQTTNEKYRRYRHEQYDPFNEKIREYNYPLSRGIRKNGLDAYKYQVIEENVPIDKLTEREQYWINYYNTVENGYNQHNDGQAPKYQYFSAENIALAKKLIKETQIPFQEIANQLNISVVMLSEINHGTRHHDNNEKYPLRELTQGRKINYETLCSIKQLLENSKTPMTKIAQQYGVSIATIRLINRGLRHHQDDWDYPLRKKS